MSTRCNTIAFFHHWYVCIPDESPSFVRLKPALSAVRVVLLPHVTPSRLAFVVVDDPGHPCCSHIWLNNHTMASYDAQLQFRPSHLTERASTGQKCPKCRICDFVQLTLPCQSLFHDGSKVLDFCGHLYCCTKNSWFLKTPHVSLSHKRHDYHVIWADRPMHPMHHTKSRYDSFL